MCSWLYSRLKVGIGGLLESASPGKSVMIRVAASDGSQPWSAPSMSWMREQRREEEFTEDVQSRDKGERNLGDLSDGEEH